MTSIRQQIINSVFAKMQTIPNINGCDVFLAMDAEMQANSISISDGGDTTVDQDVMHVRRTMTLTLIVCLEGDGGTDVTARYNQMYSDLVVAIFADPQWSGLADDTELGDFNVAPIADAQTRTVEFQLGFAITYAHRRYDPSLS